MDDYHQPHADAIKKIDIYGFDENCRFLGPVDAVPISALLELRDSLYFADQITMGGLKKLNQLIARYDTQREAEHGR